ncbi:MAG TPA: potassium-transporting ATPase subunit KdpA [Leptospiraceae bacterium]|nr:potassium-transporting ATPase subunit KdpA [Leptospirales bacterium]HMW58422.1 potassium-transporting ATPase subunit KdpA [Leptospiraceae bacterium]HMX57254.1 potassium-transporting ATPase subunit KdpA [Leptospiraceae bacterium]HMY44838.1 potassium-transporting ATPase subunit KdpA [Leptospiraceae bacterium]HMZ36576.1 potassium-transporting ATPase subunit KdpA [Leptospiraceae bacterium]
MKGNDFVEIVIYFLLLTAGGLAGGLYMARVLAPDAQSVLATVESNILRLLRIQKKGMDAREYLIAVLWFSLFSFLSVFLLMLAQNQLPLFPEKARLTASSDPVSVGLAFNTAMSFMTNTNWQAYSGESTLSYFVQMTGLTVQNFASAAVGMAVMLVMFRGFTRSETKDIGNFYADLFRITFYVLLPASILVAVFLSSQGVVQSFGAYAKAHTLEGAEQIVPLGPAASQIAIKQIGTNGGGFFGVNSSHPLENPTPLSNFVEVYSILWLAAACVFLYGKMTGSMGRAWTIYIAMSVLLVSGLIIAAYAESAYSFGSTAMEGKEVRFGIGDSVLWAIATTAASNGSVNAMHDSMMPLTGAVELFNMHLGEIVFGGVGSGMYGMLFYVILTVFLAGLMVGRTPEFSNKKIEKFEVQMAGLAILGPGVAILFFTATALLVKAGTATLNNSGPHGFSEVLYAFTSASANNGSAFAGLGVNNDFYNYALGACMLIGRFVCLIPAILIGGSLALKKSVPESTGSFRTDTPVFVILLVFFILLIGGLTFLPALTMGPIVEHFVLKAGSLF